MEGRSFKKHIQPEQEWNNKKWHFNTFFSLPYVHINFAIVKIAREKDLVQN